MLREIVDNYAAKFPDDGATLRMFREQIDVGEQLNDPANYHGHVTGAASQQRTDFTKTLSNH